MAKRGPKDPGERPVFRAQRPERRSYSPGPGGDKAYLRALQAYQNALDTFNRVTLPKWTAAKAEYQQWQAQQNAPPPLPPPVIDRDPTKGMILPPLPAAIGPQGMAAPMPQGQGMVPPMMPGQMSQPNIALNAMKQYAMAQPESQQFWGGV